ncbi:restriction endonuclease subunit S [Dictyobacter kobayashii]|uniref:Specificity protein S n=1 Tax=Dictyobacter kobayashii TaxID=2014872 RepID=A0A402AER3_9CHLR|nr:restriction endonuclease subunit S [Dictyobacter kobayashii]GCE17576.1 specificity protein S [Dictyobacter kobayashii]
MPREIDWKLEPIESVCFGIYDGPHATPKPSSEGAIFLGIGNITEDGRLDLVEKRLISEEEFPKWTKRVLPRKDDIVFTYEATLNRYAIIPEGFRGCLGRRLALIRPNPHKIDTRFLFYYFFSDEWRKTISSNIISGSTVDRIPIISFPKFPVRVPPLPIQKKIAGILSAYDDLIENNTRRIAILEEMARMLYQEWFVNFRFPGHEDVKMVESPLGMIPEGWKVKKLGDVVELAYGKALKADDRIAGDVPVYGSGGIVGFHNEKLVDGPGIIVGRKGNVGSVFLSDLGFYPIDTVFFVCSEISLYYVYYNLLRQNFINNDAAVPGLNRHQAYSLPFLLPNDMLRKKFEDYTKAIFRTKANLTSRNANLRRTRDLLLPRLISGEIDVSSWVENEPVEEMGADKGGDLVMAAVGAKVARVEPSGEAVRPIDAKSLTWHSLWDE